MTTHSASSALPMVWRSRLPPLLVWGMAASYFCLATYFSLRRHHEFLSGFDLANFDQALWLISNGDEPMMTQQGISFWGGHFELSLVVLAPLYVFGAGAGTLLVIQALAMSAVAPLLYALARAYGAQRWPAVLPALLWVVSPMTLIPNIVDFHHIPFIAPVIVGSLLALKHERMVLFAVLALVACCAKEDVPLMYVMVGVVTALEGRRKLGAAISGAALALFAFAFFVFMPAFTDSGAWFAQRFGGERGDSLADVAAWILTHPLAALTDLLSAENVLILLLLVATTGALCLLATRWMLIGLPALLNNFLSAYTPQHQIDNQYYVPVALAFSVAAAAGVHRLALPRPRLRLVAAAWIAIVFLAFPVGLRYVDDVTSWSARDVELTGGASSRRRAVAMIPDEVAVAASPRFTPHLSQRKETYSLPIPFLGREEFGSDWSQDEMERRAARVQWIVWDPAERPTEMPNAPELLAPLIPRLGFHEVARHGTVRVYVRDDP